MKPSLLAPRRKRNLAFVGALLYHRHTVAFCLDVVHVAEASRGSVLAHAGVDSQSPYIAELYPCVEGHHVSPVVF